MMRSRSSLVAMIVCFVGGVVTQLQVVIRHEFYRKLPIFYHFELPMCKLGITRWFGLNLPATFFTEWTIPIGDRITELPVELV